MTYDYLVIGQGIAGTHIAWQALQRGEQPLIIDKYQPGAASQAAGGLVNPVTGRNLTKNWRADALIPFARQTYRAQEAALGQQFYHMSEIIRLFKDQKQQRKWWNNRQYAPAYQPYISEEQVPQPLLEDVEAEFGGVTLSHGAFLHAADYLRAFRWYFQKAGMLKEALLPYDQLAIGPEGVQWGALDARCVIFCEGWAVQQNPFFSHLPMKPVKGQVLVIYAPELRASKVLNKGLWLIPLGNGHFRVGATYEHDLDTTEPSGAGYQQLCRQLDDLLAVDYKVLSRQTGVRPAMADSLPVAGSHPDYPAVKILNGLGSKGVLQAPYLAAELLNSQQEEAFAVPDADVKRYC